MRDAAIDTPDVGVRHENPLLQLANAGQAVWLDYIDRNLVLGGGLERLIRQDGVTGVTSNPSIFEKAIAVCADYEVAIAAHAQAGESDPEAIAEGLAIEDIQAAADLLLPVYERMSGRDGYVSMEVPPELAMDPVGTVEAARRLWRLVDRPNLMIKVPGTKPGCEAIRQLVGEGINVNVTLLFSFASYMAAASAHLAGLEDFRAKGGDVSRVAGVASFFISRMDTAIDAAIERRLDGKSGVASGELESLRGKVAIANARAAYQAYLLTIGNSRWTELIRAGGQPQRLLWASTGCKNPSYRDTIYVEELIGPNTVNTMPAATIEAFRDHGLVRSSLTSLPGCASNVLEAAERLGLDIDRVAAQLEAEGIKQFCDASQSFRRTIVARLSGTVKP